MNTPYTIHPVVVILSLLHFKMFEKEDVKREHNLIFVCFVSKLCFHTRLLARNNSIKTHLYIFDWKFIAIAGKAILGTQNKAKEKKSKCFIDGVFQENLNESLIHYEKDTDTFRYFILIFRGYLRSKILKVHLPCNRKCLT